MSKIFVIGLPRTGTTSISVALLEAGFKVAHTAFTEYSFELADVITDAPCFSDFKQLDKLFPHSKFIYLDRKMSDWVPSMQRLLTKMSPHLTPNGHFSPVLKRSFIETFDLNNSDLLTNSHLAECYRTHKKNVSEYFIGREDLLCIDISHSGSFEQLCLFLEIPYSETNTFPHLNKGQQVSKWRSIKHINKINSFSAGPRHRKFFDYDKDKGK